MAFGAFGRELGVIGKAVTGGNGENGGGFKNIPITSSCFARIEYNENEKTLNMTFQKGGSFQIQGIEPIEVERWTKSESVGKYFNENVRGNY